MYTGLFILAVVLCAFLVIFQYFLRRSRYSRPPVIDWSRVMDRPDVRDVPDVMDRFDVMNGVTNSIQRLAEDLSMSIERLRWEEGEQANGQFMSRDGSENAAR